MSQPVGSGSRSPETRTEKAGERKAEQFRRLGFEVEQALAVFKPNDAADQATDSFQGDDMDVDNFELENARREAIGAVKKAANAVILHPETRDPIESSATSLPQSLANNPLLGKALEHGTTSTLDPNDDGSYFEEMKKSLREIPLLITPTFNSRMLLSGAGEKVAQVNPNLQEKIKDLRLDTNFHKIIPHFTPKAPAGQPRDIDEGAFMADCFAFPGKLHLDPLRIHLGRFPTMATEISKWQHEGMAKIRTIMKYGGGGILADPMGLGKTLTAIMSFLPTIGAKYEGPVLVAVPKSVVPHWAAELKHHFAADCQPKTLVLDDNTITVYDLICGRYDFIIVTWAFLAERHKQHLITTALDGLPGGDYRKTHNSIYNDIWRLEGLAIRGFIGDEAHLQVKNRATLAHAAVKALPTSKVLLVTGTPMPNAVSDIFPMLELIPGSPFATIPNVLQKYFSLDSIDDDPSEPVIDKDRLVSYLDGVLICRPKEVTESKGFQQHDLVALIPLERVERIAALAKSYTRAIALARKKRGYVSDAEAPKHAMAKAAEARLLTFSPIVQTKDPFDVDLSKIQNWREQRGLSVADLTTELLLEFCRYDDSVDLDDEEDGGDTMDEGIADRLSEEENAVVNSQDHNNQRNAFLAKLGNMDKQVYLNEPRVAVSIGKIAEILSEDPNAKIVVFSQWIRVLDVLDAAIHKSDALQANRPNVMRFDGTVNIRNRERVRAEFSDDGELGACVFLITLGSGGQGINLSSAQNVILMERAWTKTDEAQAIHRCVRKGQKGRVHVWRVFSPNSAIEAHISARAEQKNEEVEKIMSPLRRTGKAYIHMGTDDWKERFDEEPEWSSTQGTRLIPLEEITDEDDDDFEWIQALRMDDSDEIMADRGDQGSESGRSSVSL